MKNFWNFRRVNFNLRPFIIIPCLLLSILLVSQGCKKELNSIGLDLKDQDDLLNAIFTDTITLTAHSVLDDTLNTTNLISNYLGYLKDEVFGTTIAGIYTQLVPDGNSLNPGDAPTIDSIVLTLRYAGNFYGDTLNPFTVKVYELSEDILSSETYYQNKSLKYKSENLTYATEFHLYPKPTTLVDTAKEAHARIRLKNELGDYFLRNTSQLQSPEKFKSFFKGLYICAEPLLNNGSMVNFSLTNALSGILIYYKDGTQKRQFKLKIDKDEVRFGSYQHNYESGNANFKQQVLGNDTAQGKNMLYVQSMGGVKTKITFPYLKALKNKRIVINKAELIITNIGENLNLYPNPARLGLQCIKTQGDNIVYLPDDAVYTNSTYWGGGYKAPEYRFRITRYIQDIILKDNYQSSIYLVTEGAAAYANRLILSGTNPAESSSRLRLEIYYTEY